MIRVTEKVAIAISAGALALSIMAVHVNTQVDIARMTERVDRIHETETRTVDVFDRLSISIDKLTESVTRLDERTKVLERRESQ